MSQKTQNNKDNKNLKKVVNDLIKRREQQQYRIKKLIDPTLNKDYETNNSLEKQESIFSQMLKKLDTEQPEYFHQNISNFSNHVNLLATVSLKTQVHLQQKYKLKQTGLLYQNIKNKFLNKQIIIKFDIKFPFKLNPNYCMNQLSKYIIQQQINDGLITIQETSKNYYDYYISCFHQGKYQQICLSKYKLKEEEDEMQLMIIDDKNNTVNIAWLLMNRLFHHDSLINFPKAINKLFSFPYKTFQIKYSKQLILLNKYLGLFTKQSQQSKQYQANLHIYGLDTYSNESFSIQNLIKSNNIQTFNQMIAQFNKIIIVYQKQLQVKVLPLCCIMNHFVIVTIKIKQQGLYFINIGSLNTPNKQYKIILIDEQFKIIHTQIINNNQFLSIFLNKLQYQLYIYPYENNIQIQPKEIDQSYQLVKQSQQQFNLWIQSQHIFNKYGELQLQLRLKQKYNTYSYQIAMRYIEDKQQLSNKSISQGKQQQINMQLREGMNKQDVLIKRYVLTGINLIMDHIFYNFDGKVSIQYKHFNLCDNLFQEKIVVVKDKDKIMLYCQTEVQIIMAESNQQSLEFRIIRLYI